MWGSSQITSAVVALNSSESIEQMKEATAAVENTSEYVRSEIERRKAIHDKDVADLIRQERDAYYQRALDSSLAYDDLALHGERDLEKVRGLPFAFMFPTLSVGGTARGLNHPGNKRFPAADATAVLSTRSDSIAGETCKGRSSRGRTSASGSGQVPNDGNGLPCNPRQNAQVPHLSVSYARRHD